MAPVPSQGATPISERETSPTAGDPRDDAAQAIEANICDYFRCLGLVPGAYVRDDESVLAVASGTPMSDYNVVLRTRFAGGEANREIEAVMAHFRERGLNMVWYTSANTRPPELGEHLERLGLIRGPEIPGMAVELAQVDAGADLPPGCAITPVETSDDMRRWVDVYGGHRQHAPEARETFLRIHSAVGLGPEAPWRHYLGWLGGEPVATSVLYRAAGVAGIYRVATLPAARGRGIGTAMTLAALREARAAGDRYGILDAAPDAVPLYRRLGFEVYCTLGTYFWAPGIAASGE